MPSFIQKILHLGTHQIEDRWLCQRIIVVNFITIMALASATLLVLLSFPLKNFQGFAQIGSTIISLIWLPLLFNARGKHIVSRLFFLSVSYAAICCLAIAFGPTLHFQYYCVPGVGMALVFFRDEIGNLKWVYVALGPCIWAGLEWWFTLSTPIFPFNDHEYVYWLRLVSDGLIFVTAISMFSIFTYEYDRQSSILQENNLQLRELATTDPLTNLFNRRAILERLSEEFTRAKRYHHDLALFMLDIDHFKKVNDKWGHDGGDAALRTIASHLRSTVREHDAIGRIGGEEFCMIVPFLSRSDVLAVAERTRQGIAAQNIETHDGALRVTCSIGIAEYSTKSVSPEHLMRLADQALYEAKRKGRNQIVVDGDRSQKSSLRLVETNASNTLIDQKPHLSSSLQIENIDRRRKTS